MAMDRAGTAQGRLDALSPCMANTAIPLVHRQPLLRSVYYPSLMYGCEVWGNRDSLDAEWSPTKLKHIDGALQRALTLLITGYPPGTVKLPTRSFYLPPVATVPALRDLGMHSGYSFARAMGVRQMIKYNHDPNLATAYTIMAQTNGDSAKHPNQLLRGAARGQRQSINALGIHWKEFSDWWHERDRVGSPDFSPHKARNRAYNVFDRQFAKHKGRAAAHSGGTRSMDWIDPRPPSMPSSPTHTWTAPSNACWPSGWGHSPSTVRPARSAPAATPSSRRASTSGTTGRSVADAARCTAPAAISSKRSELSGRRPRPPSECASFLSTGTASGTRRPTS